MKLNLFASCAPGLEPLLEREVQTLAGEPNASADPVSLRIVPGGVQFSGDEITLGRCLVGLGLAARLLVRIATFKVRELRDLEQHMHRLPWNGWLLKNVPRRIRVTARKSRLYHTNAIAERVLRGIQTRLGDQPSQALPQDASQMATLVVRMDQDQCTLSLDASGEPLHRRGYRQCPARAPLREDLARALVMVSGWTPRLDLMDPLCGSGTILIEAGLLAHGQAPGRFRRFGIESTVLGQSECLTRARDFFDQQVCDWDGQLMGRDQDPRAIESAQRNSEAMGWSIDWQVKRLAELSPPDRPTALVTNPPWGGRVLAASGFRKGTRQRRTPPHLASLYARLGQLRKQCPDGSRLALLTSRRALAYQTGIPLQSAFLTDAGGIKVNAFCESSARFDDDGETSSETGEDTGYPA